LPYPDRQGLRHRDLDIVNGAGNVLILMALQPVKKDLKG